MSTIETTAEIRPWSSIESKSATTAKSQFPALTPRRART